VSFAKAQMDAAQAALPRGAVLAYEVGNEVCVCVCVCARARVCASMCAWTCA
jgi:hypothetical protein